MCPPFNLKVRSTSLERPDAFQTSKKDGGMLTRKQTEVHLSVMNEINPAEKCRDKIVRASSGYSCSAFCSRREVEVSDIIFFRFPGCLLSHRCSVVLCGPSVQLLAVKRPDFSPSTYIGDVCLYKLEIIPLQNLLFQKRFP